MEHRAGNPGLPGILLVMLVCAAAWGQQAPSEPIRLKAPTMGAVTFPHSAHTRVAGKCELCHHASKPEKPLKSPRQVCTDCTTKPPTPPVKVGIPGAFPNLTATAGLCIT